MIGSAPVCLNCKFFHRDPLQDRSGENGLTCDAYPDGIPDAILFGDSDHKTPYPGDHGITFEPIKK